MTPDTEFQRKLEGLLEKDFVEKREAVLNKIHADETNYLRGYLAAIREVGEMCKRVAKELYGA